MADIRLDALTKSYDGQHAAVTAIDLSIADGEFLVLVGPSGCGKSTLLRLIAGLETPTSGRLYIGGRDVTTSSPQDRDLAMVFQNYALYPHLTVRDNLAYGLRVRRLDPAAIAQRVAEVADRLGIAALLDRRPAQLSGGERQRVALGRAIARRPRAFLLDEPLSNLDPALRARARMELRLLHRSTTATMIYVTHDQEEAMTLADRVVVMRAGAIEQVGSPLDVYAAPANLFVAGFVGSPAMNLLPAALVVPDTTAGTIAGIRPHDIRLGGGPHRARVVLVEPRGADSLVHLQLPEMNDQAVVAVTSAATAPDAGTTVAIEMPPDRVHLFTADGARLPRHPGR